MTMCECSGALQPASLPGWCYDDGFYDDDNYIYSDEDDYSDDDSYDTDWWLLSSMVITIMMNTGDVVSYFGQ